jgi:hypothetical protein
MMKHVILLFFIILLCAVVASVYIPKEREQFATDVSPYSCIDAIIERLSKFPEFNGKSRAFIYDFIAQQVKVSTAEFLAGQGININELPAETRAGLPDIDMMDLLSQFKRVTIDGETSEEPTGRCLIPVDLVNRMRNETDNNTIQIRKVPSQSVVEDKNSIFYNSSNLQCKLGNQLFTSTFSDKLAGNDISVLTTQNPGQFNFHGCLWPNTQNTGTVKSQLQELYGYSDFETMKTLRTLMKNYKESLDARTTAANTNTQSNIAKTTAIASMNAAKQNETNTFNNMQVQQVNLQNTIQPLTNSKATLDSVVNTVTNTISNRS